MVAELHPLPSLNSALSKHRRISRNFPSFALATLVKEYLIQSLISSGVQPDAPRNSQTKQVEDGLSSASSYSDRLLPAQEVQFSSLCWRPLQVYQCLNRRCETGRGGGLRKDNGSASKTMKPGHAFKRPVILHVHELPQRRRGPH